VKFRSKVFSAAIALAGVTAIIITLTQKTSDDDPRISELTSKIDDFAFDADVGMPGFLEVKEVVLLVLPEINSQNVLVLFSNRAKLLERSESGGCFSSKVKVDLGEPAWLSLAIDSQLVMRFSGCGSSDNLVSAEFSRASF
jgi:hypothetical protein